MKNYRLREFEESCWKEYLKAKEKEGLVGD
jgi:hypothetical protein